MRPVQVNQNLLLYYYQKVAPKKRQDIALNKFDSVVDKAIMAVTKGNYDIYLKCEEVLGKVNQKILTNKP